MQEKEIRLADTLFIKDGSCFALLGKDNLYAVSTDGKVYNCETGNYLRPYRKDNKKNSHLCVDLVIDGESKCYYVHQLVAEAFFQNPKLKSLIHHINGNSLDNRMVNLVRIDNRAEHGHLHGLMKHNIDEYNKEIERLRQESPLKEFTNCYLLKDR